VFLEKKYLHIGIMFTTIDTTINGTTKADTTTIATGILTIVTMATIEMDTIGITITDMIIVATITAGVITIIVEVTPHITMDMVSAGLRTTVGIGLISMAVIIGRIITAVIITATIIIIPIRNQHIVTRTILADTSSSA